MATTKTATKTAKPAKTARPAATKRAAPTNGSKPASKKIVAPKMAIGRKKPEEMSLEELTLFVWNKAYKSRHKRLDQ
jgi:hypothetical protein